MSPPCAWRIPPHSTPDLEQMEKQMGAGVQAGFEEAKVLAVKRRGVLQLAALRKGLGARDMWHGDG